MQGMTPGARQRHLIELERREREALERYERDAPQEDRRPTHDGVLERYAGRGLAFDVLADRWRSLAC
jgi:hypothetical protein